MNDRKGECLQFEHTRCSGVNFVMYKNAMVKFCGKD